MAGNALLTDRTEPLAVAGSRFLAPLDLAALTTSPHHETLRQTLTSKDTTRIFWKNETERVESLIFEFAKKGVPQQLIRWSGWAANIGEHVKQLPELVEAFRGIKGFHLFAGTEIHDLDTGALRPMICDVPAALKRLDPELVLIGTIPKVSEEPRYVQDYGVVLRVRPDKGYFTTLSDEQTIGVVLQPDVNGTYPWTQEGKESRRISLNLANKGWNNTLVVFGGTLTSPDDLHHSPTEQELLWWTEDARMRPDLKINIILIYGGGGVADKYANDAKWLAENPSVKVVKLNAESIRSTIDQLGITAAWVQKTSN